MIKLLYITNGITGSGGLERVLSVKASLLADDYGYEVTILGLNNGNDKPFYEFSRRINFLNISVSGNPLKYIHQFRNGIQKVVDQIQPDIISVCDDGLKGFFVPTVIKTKAKIIYERHVSKLIESNVSHSKIKKTSTQTKWILMEFLAKKFSRFVVLTEGNKNEWKSLKNMIAIPNPLSFYPERTSTLENKKVICVGKISYQKGQDLLVNTWELVHQRFPDWSLELYGKENNDFLNVKNYQQLNIHFYPPENNIQEKYLDSSIYVMSSRFEGFGMVLIEAMACGVPCVSFNCDYGPSDIISDGIDGLLVERENVAQLAEKLTVLIKDEPLRKEMGQLARQNAKRYEAGRIVQLWDELFKSILK